MTKFFFKFKNPYFWPISNFGGQKRFSRKSGSVSHNLRFLVQCRNSEKPNDPIPRKQPNRQQDGGADRPYFIGPFQLLPGVQQIQLQ